MTSEQVRTDHQSPRAPGLRAATVLLTVVLGAVLLGAGVWRYTEPVRHVPVPAADATPQQVVTAYLAASTAHDVATMNALSVGGSSLRASRFETTWMVSRVKTYAPSPDGGPGTAWTNWRQVVKVDVIMHTLKGHDLNFPDNTDTYWGYALGRQSDRDPWRIIDQGVG